MFHLGNADFHSQPPCTHKLNSISRDSHRRGYSNSLAMVFKIADYCPEPVSFPPVEFTPEDSLTIQLHLLFINRWPAMMENDPDYGYYCETGEDNVTPVI